MCVPTNPPGPCTNLPPAAQTSFGPVASTPHSVTLVQSAHGLGLGVGIDVHVAPFQCSENANVPVLSVKPPTAQTSSLAMATTSRTIAFVELRGVGVSRLTQS